MKVNKSFLSSIPQVSSYALISKELFDLKKLKCITFNKEGAWLYKPDVLKREIRNFLDNLNFPLKKRLWEESVFYLSI